MKNKNKMKSRENWISIVITVLFVLGFLILSNVSTPVITSYVVQDRFLINNMTIVSRDLSQPRKIEQFNDYSIKFDNALYYFTIEDEMKYVLVEFMVDKTQLEVLTKDDISLYRYEGDKWIKLDTEFIKEDGRYDYYQARSEEFGLFAVAPKEKISEELTRSDLILFAILPLCIIMIILLVGIGFLVWRFWLKKKR